MKINKYELWFKCKTNNWILFKEYKTEDGCYDAIQNICNGTTLVHSQYTKIDCNICIFKIVNPDKSVSIIKY